MWVNLLLNQLQRNRKNLNNKLQKTLSLSNKIKRTTMQALWVINFMNRQTLAKTKHKITNRLSRLQLGKARQILKFTPPKSCKLWSKANVLLPRTRDILRTKNKAKRRSRISNQSRIKVLKVVLTRQNRNKPLQTLSCKCRRRKQVIRFWLLPKTRINPRNLHLSWQVLLLHSNQIHEEFLLKSRSLRVPL